MADEQPIVASTPAPMAASVAPIASVPTAPAPAPAAPVPTEIPAPAPVAAAPAAEAPVAPANTFQPSIMEPAAAAPIELAAPDAKPEPVKPVEAAPAPAVAEPIVYDFKLPENVKPESLNQERMSSLTEWLNGVKAPPEAAQKLLDLHIAEVNDIGNRLMQAQWDVFRKQQEEGIKEIREDPVIGGSRLETAKRTCASFIEQYGGSADEIRGIWRDLAETGAGNKPRIVRLMHRAGEALAREARPNPAPPPRNPQMTMDQKRANRYAANPPPGINGRGF